MSDDTFKRWGEWMERIYDDVVLLHADRQIWREITSMIDANDQIPEREFIKNWTTQQAVEALAVGIRRQNDKRPDVVSLARLLTAIRDNPEVMSRERFTNLCSPGDDEYLSSVIDRNFDDWAGEGAAHIDPERIQVRLDALGDASEKVRAYVNKKVAHADIKNPPTGFTFEELDNALDEIGRVLKEITLLVNCVSLTSAEPAIQVPFRQSFMVPWAPPNEIDRWTRIQEFKARKGGQKHR